MNTETRLMGVIECCFPEKWKSTAQKELESLTLSLQVCLGLT